MFGTLAGDNPMVGWRAVSRVVALEEVRVVVLARTQVAAPELGHFCRPSLPGIN